MNRFSKANIGRYKIQQVNTWAKECRSECGGVGYRNTTTMWIQSEYTSVHWVYRKGQIEADCGVSSLHVLRTEEDAVWTGGSGVNLFELQNIWHIQGWVWGGKCYMARVSGGRGWTERVARKHLGKPWGRDGPTNTVGEGGRVCYYCWCYSCCQGGGDTGVKTGRRGMKCKNNGGRNGGHRVVVVGGCGAGGFPSSWPQTQRPFLVCPVFLDVEVPFPGQQIVLVIVSELRFDVILAACHQSCGSFFQRGQEVIFSVTRPVTAHHVVCLINCGQKKVDRTIKI